MDLMSKPVDMVTVFDKSGKIQPIKFKVEDENSTKVIKIDKIIDSIEHNFEDSQIILYKCESYINDFMKPFELKFDKRTYKWYLHKI